MTQALTFNAVSPAHSLAQAFLYFCEIRKKFFLDVYIC